jgi:ribosomal protein L7/L12
MTILFADAESNNFIAAAAIGAVIGWLLGGATNSKSDAAVKLLTLQMRELQKKLDALLKHQEVELPAPPPSGLSPEVELLASLPDTKIEAIKLYLKQNPGAGLREAKEKIEAFYKSKW